MWMKTSSWRGRAKKKKTEEKITNHCNLVLANARLCDVGDVRFFLEKIVEVVCFRRCAAVATTVDVHMRLATLPARAHVSIRVQHRKMTVLRVNDPFLKGAMRIQISKRTNTALPRAFNAPRTFQTPMTTWTVPMSFCVTFLNGQTEYVYLSTLARKQNFDSVFQSACT